jgi:predicted nucleic acid-binding protein
VKRRVYIETSIISYLANRPSRDIIVGGRQLTTHLWWATRRPLFDVVLSALVVNEIKAGDPDAASRRVELVRGLPMLDITPEIFALANALMSRVPLPAQARMDAAHVAVAAFYGVDYLLTWNVAHIANAVLRRRVDVVCRTLGYESPVLCTPDELMEDENEDP